jgi:hypothetical protein
VVYVVAGDEQVVNPSAIGIKAVGPQIPDLKALYSHVGHSRTEVPGL